MSLSKQHLAYRDCYEIFDSAVSLPGGCRTNCGKRYSTFEYLRARMHQARTLLREASRRAYPETHHLYNTSQYDVFKLTLRIDEDGDHWLYVEPHGNWDAVSRIEPIPEDERVLPAEAPKHFIEYTPRPEAIPATMPYDATQDELE